VIRAGTIRHAAIVLAGIAAWEMQRPLAVGPSVLYVLGAAGVANVAIAMLSDRTPESNIARALSPAVGIAAWAVLVGITGGVRSPMVTGFWLEIALAPLMVVPAQIPILVAAAVGALWLQQLVLGVRTELEALCVETSFLLVTGALTWWAAERFARKERALSADATALSGRLRALERELQDAQAIGRVGESGARLAHAATSAVHSLRGFTKLIEEPLLKDPLHRDALEGLRLAIDRLDEIARLALRRPQGSHPARRAQGMTAEEVARTLDEVIRELKPLHSSVRWHADSRAPFHGITLPADSLREVLRVILENAVEASGAGGEVALQLRPEGGMLRILVRDEGPGLAPAARVRLFEAGATTKPDGNGFGLFLARRLVEAGGGQLTLESTGGGGATFAVCLPMRED
jgi:signal transduction histidine kinase